MGGGFRRPYPAPPAGGGIQTPAPLMGGRRAAARRGGTKPPSPGRHRAASPGRWEGCGAGGPLAPRAAAGTSPKRTTGGPQTGGRPHPAAGPLGGPPPGEVGLGAGGARTQARPPTPRQGGRAGPVPARPAPDRPHTFFVPARHLRGRAGTTATGAAPPAGRFCARDSGRAEGPRGGRIRTRSDGAGGCRSGTEWGGTVRIEAGAVPPGRGAAWRQKKCRGACPSGWTRLDEKKCGEDALSPPLAVTADTRYPPVRRSSPKRTRCRPVPYALAVRRSPRPPSCLP